MTGWQPIPECKRIIAKWRLLVRAGLYLLIVGLVCWCALHKNLPRKKTVEIDASCSQLTVPKDFTTGLSSADALLESADLWGTEGETSGLKSIWIRMNGKMTAFPQTAPIVYRLSPSAVTLPYISIRPKNNYGPIILKLAKGVTLKPGDRHEEGPSLQIGSSHSGDVGLFLQAGRMGIEESRYALPRPLEPTGTSDRVQFEVVAAEAYVEMSLTSATWAMQPSRMELRFRQTGSEASLLKRAIPAGISLSGGQLTLKGCINPTILVDGKRPEREVGSTELDLALELGIFNITDISLSRTDKQVTTLRLRGKGDATSVKQDGRELMPTWIDEIVSEPYTDRGTRLILLGLLALVLFKLASRALDAILKIIIPDGGG